MQFKAKRKPMQITTRRNHAVDGGHTGGRGGLPRSRHAHPLVGRKLSQGPARKDRRGAPSREARPRHPLYSGSGAASPAAC